MNPLDDPSLDPLFWDNLRAEQPSAWHGHVPFAHWLVSTLRPRLVVELGTHAGVSYAAFCNAVRRGGLDTRCFAVDTWQGDAHAGAYTVAVFDEFTAFNAQHFAGFSTLLRSSFDDAVKNFADGSIDLLHIDGFHSYEAVAHDLQTWRPKLSPRAVVLFHDVAVRDRGFGVWLFWEEITQNHPHVTFQHAFGLGVLASGPEIPAAIAQLYATDQDRLRTRFATLGLRHEMASQRHRQVEVEDDPVGGVAAGDAETEIADIVIAERFIAPPRLAALTLPRDAVTRGTDGCSVWIATQDGSDWRCGRLLVQAEGQPVRLVFPAFANPAPRHFHLFVTTPTTPGEALPHRLTAMLTSRRPPIALGTPRVTAAVPSLPPRTLYLFRDNEVVPDNRDTHQLPITCDYAHAWRDMYGAYLAGWTHCGAQAIRRIALVIGDSEVDLELEPRPDVTRHYPDTQPVGWRGYVEGPPGEKLQLRVTTDTASRLITPDLPERLTRPPTPDPLVSHLQGRFIDLVNRDRLRVLEIGARVVGPEAIDWRGRMAQASAYIGLDIHPSPTVDIVGDAHHLTRHVAPGSQQAIWSADVIEHLRMPWLAAAEINRALCLGGLTFHIAPHSWPLHEMPADYWRFSDEGLKMLFGPAFGFEVIEAVLVEPVAIYHRRRSFPANEMPLHPGYAHAIILSRKVAELPDLTGVEAHFREHVGDSTDYPDTDRAQREAATL